MKKIAGIILMVMMVLGSFSTAFAAGSAVLEKNLQAETVLQETAQPSSAAPTNGAGEEIDENQVPLAGGEEEAPATQHNAAVDSWLLIVLILAGSAVAGLTVYFVCKTYQERAQ